MNKDKQVRTESTFEIYEKYFFQDRQLIVQAWGDQETKDYFLEHMPSDIELENLSYEEARYLISSRLLNPWPYPPPNGLVAIIETA